MNNKFKISAQTWNEKFELPDGSYYIANIQDYFEYILKKHGEKTVNPSIRIYINKTENRITFKIKACFHYFYEIFICSPNNSPWKTMKIKMLFISLKTLLLFLSYSNFCNFFSSFPHFPDSKGQMEMELFMMPWTGLHKFEEVIFGITQKMLYIISNLIR